jgi:hypothetical protein
MMNVPRSYFDNWNINFFWAEIKTSKSLPLRISKNNYEQTQKSRRF